MQETDILKSRIMRPEVICHFIKIVGSQRTFNLCFTLVQTHKVTKFQNIKNKNRFDNSLGFFCLQLLFPSKTFIILFIYNNISLPWALAFFFHSTSFASHCWTMSVYDVGLKACLWGILNSMIILTTQKEKKRKEPWCKHRPWDEFNSQS